jgi:hypothetical protein
MPRARTNITDIAADIVKELGVLRLALAPQMQGEVEDAWATVETFIAVSLRLMAKTNPSKVKSVAMTVEIQSLIANAERKK